MKALALIVALVAPACDSKKQVDDMAKQVDAAVAAVAAAKNDKELALAKAKLDELQKQRAKLATDIAAAKANAEKAERTRGVHVSKECIDNPLAKGCQ